MFTAATFRLDLETKYPKRNVCVKKEADAPYFERELNKVVDNMIIVEPIEPSDINQ